jgi:hypothetical protein
MEQHLGRLLRSDEIVHHLNGDKLDNRLENLTIMTLREHAVEHGKQQGAAWVEVVCPACGKHIEAERRYYMANNVHENRPKCCNRTCSTKFYRTRPSEEERQRIIKTNFVRDFKKYRD